MEEKVTSKILFLDFDGPMIPIRAWALSDGIISDTFDPVASSVVRHLFEKNNDIGLVISSSWRALGREKIEAMLDRGGVPSKYLHADWETKNLENHVMLDRHTEILEWISRHPEITKYVALDDFPLKLPKDNFVHVTSNDGLLFSDQRKLFRRLGARGFGL
jgi:hypothetical protein